MLIDLRTNTISPVYSLAILVFLQLLWIEVIPMVLRKLTEAEPPTRLIVCVDGTWLDPDGLKSLLPSPTRKNGTENFD